MNSNPRVGVSVVSFTLFASLCLLPSAGAQYSLNALGYADIDFVAGSNLVANPYFARDNSISNLFRGVPDGARFQPWNGGTATFQPTNQFSASTGWTDPGATLISPNGGFLWLPSGKRITFVGDVGWPAITNRSGGTRWEVLDRFPQVWPPPMCASLTDPCPQNNPPDGTQFWKWNRLFQRYDVYTFTSFEPFQPASWYDSNYNLANPQLDVAEAGLFYIPEIGSPNNWVRAGACRDEVPVSSPKVQGTNVTMTFRARVGGSFSVVCSTNVAAIDWSVVFRGVATSAVTTVTFAAPNVPGAFYRVIPGGQEIYLVNPERTNSVFRFAFYAPASTNYTVLKKPNLTTASWTSVLTVSGQSNTVVHVADNNASAARNIYVVRVSP